MQTGKNQLDNGSFFFRVQAVGDAASVVINADRAIGVQHDFEFFAVARQRFVGRIVEHLLNDVQGVVGAGVHAWSLLDGLQALEHADRAFGIFRRRC